MVIIWPWRCFSSWNLNATGLQVFPIAAETFAITPSNCRKIKGSKSGSTLAVRSKKIIWKWFLIILI